MSEIDIGSKDAIPIQVVKQEPAHGPTSINLNIKRETSHKASKPSHHDRNSTGEDYKISGSNKN